LERRFWRAWFGSFKGDDMLMPPGSPIPQATRRGNANPAARRARQVIALGLMKKGAACPTTALDSTVPVPVAVQIAQALSPAAVAVKAALLGPATVAQGQAGAVVDSSQFSDAPIIVPMNVSPEMAVQASPQALMDRRRRRKQSLAETSYRSPGVPWGGAPALQPGTACGPSAGTFLEQLRANPLAALLIASGLGVMVYAVANRK